MKELTHEDWLKNPTPREMWVWDSDEDIRSKEKAEELTQEYFQKTEIVSEFVEKMKNFYNCAYSSRALCPNEHNCKGCKDWELTEL